MWARLRQSIALRIVAAIVLFYAVYELSRQFVVISDDAYVTTDIAALAPQVAGVLKELHVVPSQAVRAGTPLFALDDTPYRIAVAEAQAAVDAAAAQLRMAERGAALAQEDDGAEAVHAAPGAEQVALQRARLVQAEAGLARAEWALQQTRVVAPFDGVVAPFAARPGDYLAAGRPVLALLSDSGWRIVANLKEADLQGLGPGSPVRFSLSTAPWTFRPGHVRSIGRGVARQQATEGVLPYIPPSSDWIALPQRFPVEIDIGDTARTERLFLGADARVLVFY